MPADGKFRLAALAFSFAAAIVLLPTGASAITADLARRCNALVAKAFPPRQPGNPAAGSSKGTAQDQRSYFQKCVENGGNVDNPADKSSKQH